MHIRELEWGDSSSAMRLMLELYDESPVSSTFDHRPSADELDSVLSGKLDGIAVGSIVDLVAEDRGRIVAECELVGTGSGSGVIGIMVESGSRRKGLGRKLIFSAMRLAAGIGVTRAYASVRRENRRALAFFEACGFTKEDGAEIVVMSRSVSGA